MAKRKRLEPVGLGSSLSETAASVSPRPPIAQVAGDAATRAALEDLAGELTSARRDGRLVISVPLEAIDEHHLVRDRTGVDPDSMDALVQSIRSRGQQTPIDVVELGEGHYGLISGWRRMQALRQLHKAGQGDGTVKALLRKPEVAEDAYRAMVDENEIRVGLSYYERARIAARAAEEGVFPSLRAALQGLFDTASRARRSKIKSFVSLYRAFDTDLRFAHAIPERLGLALVKALEADKSFIKRVRQHLAEDTPATAEAEAASLQRVLNQAQKRHLEPKRTPETYQKCEIVPGIALQTTASGLVLSGPGITKGLRSELEEWLKRR